MRRRDFIGMLGGAAAWPIAAAAQTTGRVYRLGWLNPLPRPELNRLKSVLAIFDEMRLGGFVEGQNLEVLHEGLGAKETELAAVAAALIKASPDVILAAGSVVGKAAQTATRTIPIVAISEDMVADGFSTSLARPDGNVTGVSLLSPTLDGKRGDLLRQALPGLRQMAVLADPGVDSAAHIAELNALAAARGLELSAFFAKTRDEIVPALDAAKASGAGAVNVLANPLFYYHHRLIIERLRDLDLPAVYQWPDWAEQGALIGYGPSLDLEGRILGRQLVKILRGTALSDIPIEQPTKFELAINLKTAKALGLEIPATLLAAADEVIE
jgi:putative tryptophan/tyrosine transport system substrate-binding protein